jgi:6-phosphogluconate dehydrogenase
MNKLSDFGMIGLAVMGENLALNIESKGFKVSVYNRSVPGEERVVDTFLEERAKGRNVFGTNDLKKFFDSIERPRKIMMMIKAGSAVDQQIDQLLPYLEMGDIIIDGGNSHFIDSIRRTKYLEKKGFYFIGTGVSYYENGSRRI